MQGDEKCLKCKHLMSLHKDKKCTFVVNVSDDGKTQTRCNCNYI